MSAPSDVERTRNAHTGRLDFAVRNQSWKRLVAILPSLLAGMLLKSMVVSRELSNVLKSFSFDLTVCRVILKNTRPTSRAAVGLL